uniref:glutamate--tRNA ligase n=1 Tax=Lotharella oceanica TaxID=641309 RepID=A0A7S2U3Y7_9EUKA|mmetsp:Transcript_630/g.1179  ORF Transcript_630/g.1179 Transcript_630/m.1179 type:complete len:586 (+) Transcript_630:3-1760(+)
MGGSSRNHRAVLAVACIAAASMAFIGSRSYVSFLSSSVRSPSLARNQAPVMRRLSLLRRPGVSPAGPCNAYASVAGMRRRIAAAAEGPVRVRFAPSPTGSLHVGGARTALYNWMMARKEDEGKFVLRVEDTDVARSTRESEESVLADLEWLGLKWDEGPFRQSERGEIYKEMVEKLVASGHAYPCFSTEEELEAAKQAAIEKGENPKYDGKWRDVDPEVVKQKLENGEPHTYRFKVPKGEVVTIQDKVRGTVSWDAEATLGDFILLRSTGIPVYNFCVAVDDALMGISTVVRAEEHLTNTLRQVLILKALGYTPPEYAHLSLILGQDKQKLSKRHGATSVTQFKEEGFLPSAMINYLSLLGWNEGTEQEIYSTDDLIDKFTLERVIKSPAVFDMDKLKWVNSQKIRELEEKELSPLIKPFLESAGLPTDEGFLSIATKMAQQRMEVLADAPTIVKDALAYPLSATLETKEAKKLYESDDDFPAFAAAVVDDIESGAMPAPSADLGTYEPDFKKWTKALGKKTGRKGKGLFMPLRLLLTGRMQGPEVPQQLALGAAAAQASSGVVSLEARTAQIRETFTKEPAHSA